MKHNFCLGILLRIFTFVEIDKRSRVVCYLSVTCRSKIHHHVSLYDVNWRSCRPLAEDCLVVDRRFQVLCFHLMTRRVILEVNES